MNGINASFIPDSVTVAALTGFITINIDTNNIIPKIIGLIFFIFIISYTIFTDTSKNILYNI